MTGDDKARGDNTSKLAKLVHRLSIDDDNDILQIVRIIKSLLKARGSDIHDLADSIEKLEKGSVTGADREFYKQAYLSGYKQGAEDERKKMPRNNAIGFSLADTDELTPEAAVMFAHQNLHRLNAFEQGFIADMAIQMKHAPSKGFSERQTALIFKIYRRAGGKI